jgi:hypothetical protein
MSDEEHVEQEPEVFAVEIDDGGVSLSRRHFVELAAASAATAMVATGCGSGTSPHAKAARSHTSPPTPSQSPTSPSPTPPAPSAPAKPPGRRGKVHPGHTGTEYQIEGKSYTMRCGEPIPPGAVCTCNCVSVPPSCSCVGNTCSCVGNTGCSCVGNTGCSVVTHYWYPN